MQIEDVIGQRIRERRDQIGMTQAQIGEELGNYLNKPWPRQAVSAAEKGGRAFTAAELVALSLVLGCGIEDLLRPPDDVADVTLGEGATLSSDHLRRESRGDRDADLAAVDAAIGDLRRHFAELRDDVHGAATKVGAVEYHIARSVQALSIASRASEPDDVDKDRP